MPSYAIEGGRKLEGEVTISGSKNASLPIIAASILNGNITKLYQVPDIHDTKVMIETLKTLGCQVKRNSAKIVIDSKRMNTYEIPENLMREMRSSVIIAGAMLGRFRTATFSYPGGCDIGSRPIDLHLKGFEKLGAKIQEESGYIKCSCDTIKGANIHLDFPSVGATENIMLASVLAEGTTCITNSAKEPEIVDLAKMLNRMGAKIEGAGTDKITIQGVKNLKPVSYNIMPDRIEAGTFLCMVAATGGKALVKNIVPEHLTPILHQLENCGCQMQVEKNTIAIEAPKKLKATDIKTMPYPRIPNRYAIRIWSNASRSERNFYSY